ncbi:MOSC domain-containing protein [Alkalimarinus sediminis]|uniref:MOSC domain-containing protein n=1 Tax=Alkalimarinus sediminis TaxID=1632866 RepID=A0A9E8HK58_9ALTE|nr:MOSC domain-containing protein [Alkalimarinus sediminis]UZW75909.1 MOSC domain-containing protein [Alkalimarinus sediminis]
MKLTAINKYPVKSLKGLSLDSSLIDEFGIENDRRWMLVDSDGRFVTQRKHPIMGTIAVEDRDGLLRFTSAEGSVLDVQAGDFVNSIDAQVWSDNIVALGAGDAISGWFSELLGTPVNLVYMPDSTFRQVDRNYADYKQRVGFADGFPFLLISEASLEDLNSRLDSPVAMSRFRPNLVVTGCDAFEEDSWQLIRIGDIEFELVKPCSRCIMTTIDEVSLNYGKEPLKTLATYRRNDYGVCFGQNLVHQNQGVLSVGANVEVLKRL